MTFCVLIPVLNEARTIGPLVAGIRAQGLDVVVVDDGSTDGSGGLAAAAGAAVIRHEVCQGKGRALRDGFDWVCLRDYGGVVTMDGDGQHAVGDIRVLLNAAHDHPEAAIINGSRMGDQARMPVIRRWTNRLMSLMISWLCRQRIPDTQCGFRLIRRAVLETVALTSGNFQIETEVLVKASRAGFQIVSVPVQTIYSGEKSRIRPVVDTCRFVAYFVQQVFIRFTS